MHKGEIVEVTPFTGDHKARRQGGRLVFAIVMDVACTVGLERVGFQFEIAGIHRGEEVARRADTPGWEDTEWHANTRRAIKGCMRALLADWWREQLFDLWAECRLDGMEQALFVDLQRVSGIPIIQAHHQRGDVWQVDDRTHSVRQEQLAGSHLPDSIFFQSLHGCPPSAGAFSSAPAVPTMPASSTCHGYSLSP